ncbi:MAG: uracil-DNA glycosylase [Halobacteriales archaeon]|nr:uracil-DNA glycosylase [Halobacteriales archaeon]
MDYTVDACERCDALVESRSRIVNGVGDCSLGVVFVGEAPGADEDAQGEPFVGRSGEVLTEKLNALGVSRDEVRITNSVRCRPPDNRDPRVGELANCFPYLVAEIDTLDPNVVCTLGRVPTTNLVDGVGAMRDVVGDELGVEIGAKERLVVPCYHPAAMLYDRSKEETIDETLARVVEIASE